MDIANLSLNQYKNINYFLINDFSSDMGRKAPLLYSLNVSELRPTSAIDYKNIETTRIQMSLERASLEAFFLNAVKQKHYSHLMSLDINNKKALFEALTIYMRNKMENTYVEWFEQAATLEDAKNFVSEYGADQVYFTQYLSQLSIIAPERAAVEIYSNLFDETGLDINNRNNYSISLFHPCIFRRLSIFFNVEPAGRFHNSGAFNPETYYCICMMLLSIRLGYLQGAGALFFLESSISEQMSKINSGLKRLGLQTYERFFLEIHCELDTTHAANWWNNSIKDYLTTKEALYELILGIDLAISARNQLWHGLYIRARNDHKNTA